jgi:multiple sugar transport system ATP-binding protein
MADVKLNSITKTFGDITAVDDMNLEVKDKEFFVLLGPTGAGKTTTLRMISGLEKQDNGDILLDNETVNDMGPALRDVAFVFQYYTLYPTLTVRQNLEFPLKSRMRNVPQDEIEKRIGEVAKVLNIEKLLDRSTLNLSGGEMQRVAIGRAIVRTPRIFLMDEPLSNLDAKLREEMRVELARIHLELEETFIYVTHDQIEAMTMADRIGVLNEGKILQIGSPEDIYERPACVFVAKFVGSPSINSFDAVIDNDKLVIGDKDMICCLSKKQCTYLDKLDKKKIIFGIRPEDIEVTREKKDDNSIQGEVYFSQSMGAEDILNLSISKDILLRAIAPPKTLIKTGEKVFININMDRAHLFDASTENRIKC